jgi:tetratricopeptide (TPR) repeat protein
VYRRVVDRDATNLAGLAGLQRVYQATQRWSELVVVLERQLDAVVTERARVDLLLQLARIQEEQFLKADLAARRLEQVLEIDPTAIEAYRGLERCYRRLKQWNELIATCERHISEVGEVSEKVELHEQIAKV